MNYEKKRKRQSGRQKRKEPQYKIWIDEWANIHATLDRRLPGLTAAPIGIPQPLDCWKP